MSEKHVTKYLTKEFPLERQAAPLMAVNHRTPGGRQGCPGDGRPPMGPGRLHLTERRLGSGAGAPDSLDQASICPAVNSLNEILKNFQVPHQGHFFSCPKASLGAFTYIIFP